jgi:hypothetical protein
MWPEIVDHMHGHNNTMDRPDVVARVFHMKQRALLEDIRGKGNRPGCFGLCTALTWTVEYQKRGLPHMHLLVWLAKDQAYLTPDLVDEWVRAEFPTPRDDPDQLVRGVIERAMCHGPCGEQEEVGRCMVKKKGSDEMCCSAHFPFSFQETTQLSNDGYPLYRRRDNGQSFMKMSRVDPNKPPFRYTNQWVVPHNLHVCYRYNAHVNLQAAQSIMSPKYLFKYITKGHDKANAKILNEDDEIERHLQCRYISPTSNSSRYTSRTRRLSCLTPTKTSRHKSTMRVSGTVPRSKGGSPIIGKMKTVGTSFMATSRGISRGIEPRSPIPGKRGHEARSPLGELWPRISSKARGTIYVACS